MENIVMFTHLHTHSEYSFLDGIIKVKDLVKRAKELNMNSLALTDHGNMCGIAEFYSECVKNSIKPIVGFEAYVNQNNEKKEKYNHLILIAKNNIGWKNLIKLCSSGYIDNYYYKPRINFSDLKDYSGGIICMSACLGGSPQKAIINDDLQTAEKIITDYLNIFKEDYYLEIQNIGQEIEKKVNQEMINFGKKLSIPVVATNDIHFLNKKDEVLHDVALCMATKKSYSDESRWRIGISEIYFKSEEEMLLVNKKPHCENTQLIVDKCDDDIKIHNKIQFPSLYENVKDLFKKNIVNGLKNKYKTITDEIKARANYELKVISKMDFEQYLLMVQDICKMIDKRGIMRNCRGSAAGSIICYALDITKIDPLKHGLLFERFLNPARISMPDVDIDLEDKDRHLIIDDLIEKYGRTNISQIVSYNKLKAKAVFKDVAKVFDMPYQDANICTKSIDPKIGKLEEIQNVTDFRYFDQIMEYSKKLEKNVKGLGIHAAGIVIAPDSVDKFVPLYKSPKNENIASQVSMDFIEDFGLIKFDLLGLATLNIIKEAVNLIKDDIDVWNLELNDKKVYELFHRGELSNVFQYESAGIQEAAIKLKPNKIGDISALGALYRPGPIKEIPSFCARKNGTEKVIYPHECLKEILDDTYGIIVYQEQIIQIAQKMCGFTLGEADILRKAVSKKKESVIAEMREKFNKGAISQGYTLDVSNKVYDLIEYFASYGFNRAHAMSYAHISYFCAYLKVHYPLEFYAGVLTNKSGQSGKKFDDFVSAKVEAERLGITILSPDVNKSELTCCIEDGSIRLPLNSIKNVGKCSEIIIKNRDKDYTMESFLPLCSQINKRELESIIKAGCFDSIEPNRAIVNHMCFENNVLLLEEKGHLSWNINEILIKEKETLGYYKSGHPLDNYSDLIESFCCDENKIKNNSMICGIVKKIKKHRQKNGGNMAFLTIETKNSFIDIPIFSESYKKFKKILKLESAVFIVISQYKNKNSVSKAILPNKLHDSIKKIMIDVTNISDFLELKEYIDNINDEDVVTLEIKNKNRITIAKKTKITKNIKLLKQLKSKFNITLKMKV